MKALKWLFMEHAPLILRPKIDAAMILWMLKMLSNCASKRYAINKSRMLRLADYSRISLGAMREETGIAYNERMQGTSHLFRTQGPLDASAKDVKALAADGIPYEVLAPNGCIRVEPALKHVREKIVGGLLTPKGRDWGLLQVRQRLGGESHGAGRALQLWQHHSRPRCRRRSWGVITAHGRLEADAVVVTLGSFSPLLVRSHGIRLPVYPVKGYSLTIPLTDEARAPVSTGMDETFKIGITRLSDRIRVGGMAEISGYANDLGEPRRLTLQHSFTDLFPGGDVSKASFWSGLRPMTPDGTPVIGATKVAGLFLNTGHGTLGWTMSSGSARIVADLISGRNPEIDALDLGTARYG
ncbi:D-amino-acid dehydrogenase [Neorhizobium sp. 2083]|nr:D-amino-acid dehydrogenase [Neorhizobium sp. 2083]